MPYGRGWALVGDAGVVMDPASAQGISNALVDAERLTDAVADGLGGTERIGSALDRFHRRRDAAIKPMYDLTVGIAKLRPPRAGERCLLEAVADRQADVDRLLSVFAGILPVSDLRSPRNVGRLLGRRAATTLGRARLCPTG